MELHTLVFIQEYGPVIGQYPMDKAVLSQAEYAHERTQMDLRWVAANQNPACLAAFWFVDGQLYRRDFRA